MSEDQATKRCARCKVTKALVDFHRSRRAKDGRQPACKICQHEQLKERARMKPDAVREAGRRYREANREKIKAYWLAHPDKAKAAQDRYRKTHGAALLKRSREYYQANRERIRAQKASLYQANIERERVRCRDYRRAHPEIAAAWSAKNVEKNRAYSRRHYSNNPEKCRKSAIVWAQRNPEYIRLNAAKRRAKIRSVTIGDTKSIRRFYEAVEGADRIACYWCGKNVPRAKRHVDHITPLNRGGAHAVDNLCCACASCNQHKSDKLPAEFTGQHELFCNA